MTYQLSPIGKFTCDVPWCNAVSPGALDETAARGNATAAGWSTGPAMDLCPAHHAAMVAEVTNNAG